MCMLRAPCLNLHFLPLYTTWIECIECIECNTRVILDLIRLYFSTAHTKIRIYCLAWVNLFRKYSPSVHALPMTCRDKKKGPCTSMDVRNKIHLYRISPVT